MTAALATQSLVRATATEAFLDSVSHDFSREHLVLWCELEGQTTALHAGHTDPAALHNVSVLLGEWPKCAVVDSQWLAARIDASYTAHSEAQSLTLDIEDEADDVEEAIARLVAATDADLLSTSGKSPVVRLIDSLLFEGVRRGASDIHFQPSARGLLVRFRIDGALIDTRELPPRLSAPVASRIKVMGHMDIAETRMAQDGRASVTIGLRDQGCVHEVDLRISTLPTSDGERVVVRFLDSNQGQRLATLDAIGMSSDLLGRYRASVCRPNGIVLLTGPTGSGKTTTLYATLREIATSGGAIGGGDLNIMTIEDPIEYKLNAPGLSISQSQVNRMKGMTFASGLRHILRQDPDVVMVGEIRDTETARIAIQSSLTGHLVFSTLHTNDSVSAPPRLIDLGIEPYLIGASLSAVLAQRLVRLRHLECGGRGCDVCLQSGYAGRTGIFELLQVNDQIHEMIAGGATATELRRVASGAGWRSLREDGLRLVEGGQTTLVEIERVAVDLGEELLA